MALQLAATIPVEQMAQVNADLDAAGYGPNNFSVPIYTNSVGATHATLHAWGNNNVAFYNAVKAIPNVEFDEGEAPETITDPTVVVTAAITPVSGHWAQTAPPLQGVVTPGLYEDVPNGSYPGDPSDEGGVYWWVIQQYDTSIDNDPNTVPAQVRKARDPYTPGDWVQALDQYDAYKLVNDFTQQPDQAYHNGQLWEVEQADGSGNNVWEPGVFGWVAIGVDDR